MSDWKYHISHKFGTCRLVANARDPHRGRDVKLYHIPGNFEYVGIDDGTDCFVAPVTIDPFSAGIKRIFDDIRAGKAVEVRELPPQGRRVAPAPPQMELPLGRHRQRVRVAAPAIQEQPAAKGRRRVQT